MSLLEVVDELGKFVKGEGTVKNLNTYIKAQEAKKDGKHKILILCLKTMKSTRYGKTRGNRKSTCNLF